MEVATKMNRKWLRRQQKIPREGKHRLARAWRDVFQERARTGSPP